jgi:hypothetical protein
MKTIFTFLLAVVAGSVFSQQTVINDSNATVRDIPAFVGIRLSGGIDVYISQGDACALAVSASEEKYRDRITAEVKNGILEVSYRGDFGSRNLGDKKLRAYISYTTLESIQASGACGIFINGVLNVNTLFIKLSGASSIQGSVKLSDLSFEMSGASTVSLTGAAENLKIVSSGASDMKGYDLQVKNCVAKLSGASDIRLTVSNSIAAVASGASTLFYEGSPEKRDIATSGASAVLEKKEP